MLFKFSYSELDFLETLTITEFTLDEHSRLGKIDCKFNRCSDDAGLLFGILSSIFNIIYIKAKNRLKIGKNVRNNNDNNTVFV